MQQVAEIQSMPVSESTFADLLRPLIEPGFRLALAMLHDPQAAEDAVQDASFTAWRKIGRMHNRGRLRPWVRGVVANKGRRRKETIVFGLRVPLAIAATFLLVALVAAALVTWNAVHNNTVPAGHVLTGLQQLEARPLNLPTLKQTDVCPNNPGVNSLHYDYGSGPVYVDG